MKIMTLTTADGTAFVMLPPHDGVPPPTLLLFAMSGTDTLTTEPYCRVGRLLHARGWNVVSLDLPCHGADCRKGEPQELEGWAARIGQGEDLVAAFRQQVNDVVDHLVSTKMADPTHLAVAGTSRGGFLAFHAAVGNPRLRAIAAFSPVTDLEVLNEFCGLKDHPLVRRLALATAVELLANRAAWVTIGNADTRVGTKKAVAFMRALTAASRARNLGCDVTLHVVPVAGHASLLEWHAGAAAWFQQTVSTVRTLPEPGHPLSVPCTVYPPEETTGRKPGLNKGEKNMKHIQMTCDVTDIWFIEKLGRGRPNPITTSLKDMACYWQDRERVLHEHLGEFSMGSVDPEFCYTVPQHDGRNVIAAAFGAAYPDWDELSGSFVLPTNAHPWAGLDSIAALKRLPIPDWEQNPLMQENRRKWEEIQTLVGSRKAAQMPLNWSELRMAIQSTGKIYRMSGFPTFLDLGGFLMGSTEFLTVLGTEPEFAGTLLQKCFEISASYSDYMCKLYGRPRTAWCSMGGDNSCLVSAEMYRSYAMTFDRLVREKCGNLPRNLHSCGASQHLYKVWGEYPEREQIVLMQTRAIPGAMSPLRASLPHTFIQLTIHQPQVDFEKETPNRVKELVWDFAEAMGFRDMSVMALVSTTDVQCKANLAAFFEAGREVNDEAKRRHINS